MSGRHQVILPGDKRKRDLAAIHAGAKQLNLDEDTRRDLIERITGQRSAGALDDAGRAQVLQELRRLGAGGKPGRHPGKPLNMDARPMLARIEQLLTAMQMQWTYADRLAQHMYRIERCAWLKSQNQLGGVIAALDAEYQRRQIQGMCDALGLDVGVVLHGIRSDRRQLAEIRETLKARLADQAASAAVAAQDTERA